MPLKDPDLIGSITGIFKLEDTYLIDTIDFAFGNASKSYPSFRMKGFFFCFKISYKVLINYLNFNLAKDCFHIGSTAYENKDWQHAITWYKAGFELWKNEENKEEIKSILNRIIDAAKKVYYFLNL